MPAFSAYAAVPSVEQMLHGLHVILCAFAVLAAAGALATEKGSIEHKFFGFIYLPLSAMALMLACFMAWREASMVLFCFDGLCAYLLISGWRAVHAHGRPGIVDWSIPAGLFALACGMAAHAFIGRGEHGFYLLFFASGAFYLSWRDASHLRRHAQAYRYRVFFPAMKPDWIGRHIAGMTGSAIANLSVVALTLLPPALHWLWPMTLFSVCGFIAWRERQKKQRSRRVPASPLPPNFRPSPVRGDQDIRRAA